MVTTRLCARACPQLVPDVELTWPNFVPDVALTWSNFSTTLGRNWIRTDTMDLLICNLQPFLPDSVIVMTSLFGTNMRNGNIGRLHRWKCFRELRRTGKKILRLGWPDCVGGHWYAFWVDLEPTAIALPDCACDAATVSSIPLQHRGATFHAMDSLNVGPRRGGYNRTGNRRPLSVGLHFQNIFEHFIQFLKEENSLYQETSVFGVVPSVDLWEARTMDAGFPKHVKMCTKHDL